MIDGLKFLTEHSINIGGDILVAGNTSQNILIPDPNYDLLEEKPLQRLTLNRGAIATSGSSERSIKIGSQSYSHIFDPRTGQPCSQIVSATVIARNAETADVLATICSVLPVDDLAQLDIFLQRYWIDTEPSKLVFSRVNHLATANNSANTIVDKNKYAIKTPRNGDEVFFPTRHQKQLHFEIEIEDISEATKRRDTRSQAKKDPLQRVLRPLGLYRSQEL